MSFLKLDLKTEYRNQHIDVLNEFYLPLFEESKLYCRAVGFFSSSIFARYAIGLHSLAKNKGKIKIVASPALSDEDFEAIKKGYEIRSKIIHDAILRELYEPKNLFEKQSLNLLANYIADGTLDLKIALLGNKNHNLGIYHEKLGLLYDEDNNIVAFSGSPNESQMALEYNYETIDVFCSWKNSDKERVSEKEQAFNSIWQGNDDKIEVFDFPDVNEEIIKKYKYTNTKNELDENVYEILPENSDYETENVQLHQTIEIPETVTLYDYQKQAINNWQQHNYIGIFDMATGTGKTFTGIGALCELYKNQGMVFAVIVCPYQHLVEQWVEDLEVFGIKPIIGYGSPQYKGFRRKLKNAVFDFNLQVKDFGCFICTKDTFADEDVQKSISEIHDNCLLLVDEAHNIGAQSYLKLLNKNMYKYRLALSATLDRFNDEVGTQILHDFFGEKCIEYDIERAINEGKLTRYYYYPITVELTESELEKYISISKEIFKRTKIDKYGNSILDESGKMLAIKRARIVAGANNKTQMLLREIEQYKNDNHILIYCGATTQKENEYNEEEIRQIDNISKQLWNQLGIKTAQFTANENSMERKQLIRDFAEGDVLQGLVAIKCLDEGVNVPAVDKAFILASTTNPKEYIQRRGRVLRKYKGKEYSVIYDFVTLPRRLADVKYLTEEEMKYERTLIKNELTRIIEFSRIAENSIDSVNLMMKLKDAYGLYEEEDND